MLDFDYFLFQFGDLEPYDFPGELEINSEVFTERPLVHLKSCPLVEDGENRK